MLSFYLKNTLYIAVTVLIMAVISLPLAADQSTSDRWNYGAEIYLWGAGIGGTTQAGDDIDILFSDLLDNLDMALMTKLAARKNKWTLFTDIIYMDVSASQKGTANIIGRPVDTKTDVGLESWIVTSGGGYAISESDTTRLDLHGGVRYLWMKNEMKFDLGEHVSRKASGSEDIWDAIVGIRGNTRLNEKWYLTYYADMGAGESDITWQVAGAINYRFSKLDLTFGYRYLDWDFDEDTPVYSDLNIDGPYAGVKFFF